MLLQIASLERLVSSIPVDVWSWLTRRPPLPPTCMQRYVERPPNLLLREFSESLPNSQLRQYVRVPLVSQSKQPSLFLLHAPPTL